MGSQGQPADVGGSAPGPVSTGRAATAGAPGRTGMMTRRLAALVLGSQAPVVVFAAVGARALAASSDDPAVAGLHLGLGLALAGLCVVAAGLTRWRVGLLVGWLAQLATFAYAVVVPMMVVVGVIFGGLWLVAVIQGAAADRLTFARSAHAVPGDWLGR